MYFNKNNIKQPHIKIERLQEQGTGRRWKPLELGPKRNKECDGFWGNKGSGF